MVGNAANGSVPAMTANPNVNSSMANNGDNGYQTLSGGGSRVTGNHHQSAQRDPVNGLRRTTNSGFNMVLMVQQKLLVTEQLLKISEERNQHKDAQIEQLCLRLMANERALALQGATIDGGESVNTPNVSSAPHHGNHAMLNVNFNSALNALVNTQLSASAPPYTPKSRSVPATPKKPKAVGNRPSTGRRHRRTETPEQLSLRSWTNGVPIYTVGIDPQNERGLLHDFFEDVQYWALCNTKDLSSHEITLCANHPDVINLLGGKTDIENLLMDKEMRVGVVVALLAEHLISYTIGEQFLIYSGHPAAHKCHELLLKFTNLTDNDHAGKRDLCQEQKKLYTGIITDRTSYRAWRDQVIDGLCEGMLEKISCFLKPGDKADRIFQLGELYVKGYRTAFRFREQAVKWQITWPKAGTDLNLSRMVNKSRELLGDNVTTLNKLQSEPDKFCVRFALTPTFTKIHFIEGNDGFENTVIEKKEVIHSALVYIGRKGVFNHKDDSKN